MNTSFWYKDKEFKLRLQEKEKNKILVKLEDRNYEVAVENVTQDEMILEIDGKIFNTMVAPNSNGYAVYINGKCLHIEKRSEPQLLGARKDGNKRQEVKTSMPGRIVKVLVENGALVKEGEAVLILEAMKMQNEIKSPQAGTIKQIGPAPGDSVEVGAILFTVD